VTRRRLRLDLLRLDSGSTARRAVTRFLTGSSAPTARAALRGCA